MQGELLAPVAAKNSDEFAASPGQSRRAHTAKLASFKWARAMDRMKAGRIDLRSRTQLTLSEATLSRSVIHFEWFVGSGSRHLTRPVCTVCSDPVSGSATWEVGVIHKNLHGSKTPSCSYFFFFSYFFVVSLSLFFCKCDR